LPMVASSDAPRFRRWSGRLETPSWERLKARGAQAGLTPSAILLTAFADVLASFGGKLHFTINLTLFNRREHHPEIDAIVGDFTSVNLLEVSLATPETFERRARRLQGQLWSDLDHSRVSGVRVMRELARIGRGRVLMPIVFTSTLGLAGHHAAFPEPMRLVDEISQTPQVALDHQVSESETGLNFVWDVVAALFPADFVPAMFESYCGWLRQLSEDEGAWQAVSRNLVPAAQLAGRLEVNATAALFSPMRLHELFLSQVARRRDQPAVISPARQLSYGELEQGSANIAARLCALGLRPGELVGVLMEKGWEQIVAVLAVLRAGAVYLPVDPGLPPERVSHLLQRGEVRFVLTQSWLEDALALPEGVQRLCVAAGDLDARPEDWSEIEGSANDLAYVIYTSGSTGLPKGVMIDHRGAVNTVLDINRRWAIEAGDRVLALSSLSFDLSVYDIFGPLAAGGAIVVPEASKRPDPAHWVRMCARHGVTVWNSVPALMELLLEHLQQSGEKASLPLRLVMLSGDWIAVTLPDRLRSVIGSAAVVSLGGATEASIWSIGREVAAVDPGWVSIPYGRPLLNQTFHVLNEAGEECPEWVSGELYIGGAGVALGYWRDGGRTAERFVPSPYGDGARLYRTGDLGRWLPGGEIEFLGRRDFQVKVQGHRIELGEIEATLLRHDGVKDAVVIAREDSPGDKRLVAYVTAADGAALETGELREHLKLRLPDYMVPSAFMVLEALPLTPNGKIDRKALPSVGGSMVRGSYVAPRSATEEVLARIWGEVLGLERVGAQDNFFELGGHSLLAMRMSARLNEAFGVELPLRTLFETPVLSGLAEQIVAVPDEQRVVSAVIATDPAGRFEKFPLTDVQQAYWIGRTSSFALSGAAHSYSEFEFERLDVDRFELALRRLIERHDMLRMVVHPDGEQQVLERVPPYCLRRADLRGMAEAEAEAELARWRDRLSHQVLDSTCWPLFEIGVCLLDGGRVRLFVSIDLLITDAGSRSVIMQDLVRFYADPAQQDRALTLSFRDCALAQKAAEAGEAYRRDLAYWPGAAVRQHRSANHGCGKQVGDHAGPGALLCGSGSA
ncbi:amino acid adenylation domain-containing protein, partial [Bradyrhizobium sp. PRIMUS42]|uniref:non-ribosomal peptide synthetase n=1 Tax=Bradyrhizobium sp. PRIMUS42 TaxID=2908926 RepID=UPI001FF3A8F2